MPRLSRRALGAILLSGCALAAFGASAQTAAQAIRTPELGLTTARFNIPAQGGGTMPAYVAYPAARGRWPVILLVTGSSGVDEYMRDTARRLARAGYFAVVPDFFFRAGDPSAATDNATLTRIVTSATNEQVMGDISAALFWAKQQPAADRGKIGITGFSWGGAFVWMAMQRFPDFKSGVAWYGRLRRPTAPNPLANEERPWPLDVAATLRAPVLGLYAANDPGIPVADVEEMKTAMTAARKRNSTIIVYDGAQHDFHRDDRPSYNQAAATDGWSRMLAHFAANGLRTRAPRDLPPV